MSVKDRISQFIKFKGLRTSQFEVMCDLSNGYISSMRKGFGEDKLNNVLNVFPDLNREWLLYGEGQMLKSDTSQQVGNINGNAQGVNVNGSVSINEAVDKFLDEIAAQRRMTEKCMEQMDRLIKLLEDKQ